MNRHSILNSILALASAGWFSGCAVLTVDVDVYKGPLANHEHVLTEQTAVMAIGAKPLLIQLKDELCRNTSSSADNVRMSKIDENKYLELIDRDHIDKPCENADPIKKQQAQRVEAVLELYEDRFVKFSRMQEYASRIDKIQKKYQSALQVVDGRLKEEKAFWKLAEDEIRGKGSAKLQSQLDNKKAELPKLQFRIDSEKAEIAKFQSQLSNKKARIAELQSKLDSKKAGFIKLQTRLSSQKAEIAKLQIQLDNEEAKLPILESQFYGEKARIAELQSQISSKSKGAGIAKLQSQLDSKNVEIIELQTRLDNKKTEIANLQSQLNSKEVKLPILESQFYGEKARIAGLQSQISSKNKETKNAELQFKLNTKKAENAKLQSRVNRKKAEIAKLSEIITKRAPLIQDVWHSIVRPPDGYRRVRHLTHSYFRLRQPSEARESGPVDGQTTVAYAFLEREDVQKYLSEILFGSTKSRIARKFVKRMAIIARSFSDARQASRDLWRESARFLVLLHNPTGNELEWFNKNQRTRSQLTLALARLIAELTDVKDVAVALYLFTAKMKCNDKGISNGESNKIIEDLHKLLVEQSDENLWKICRNGLTCNSKAEWPRSRYDQARLALESAIIAQPKKMVDLLLKGDEIFREIPNHEFKDKLPANTSLSQKKHKQIKEKGYARFQELNEYKVRDYRWDYYCSKQLMPHACKAGRKYGFVSVPTPEQLKNLTLNIEDTKRAGGVGLDSGRLPEGLDTLIENYLKASKKRDADEIKKNLSVLLDALVRFAEKVLFIANHEELIKPKVTVGATHNLEKQSSQDELNKYVLTLQAIGNAIIVQVDELVRRRAHQKGLDGRAETEFEALQRVAHRSASEVISKVLENLSDMQVKMKQTLTAKNAEKQKADKKVADMARSQQTAQETNEKLEAERKKQQEIDEEKSDANKMAKSLEDEVKKLKEREKAISDAIALVKSVTGDTLSTIHHAKVSLGPATVFGLLQAEIAKRAASTTIEKAQKNAAKNAMKVLDELPVPLEIFSGMQGASNKDAKNGEGEEKKPNQIEVLDTMTAHLRYALIRAESDGRTEQAEQIRKAIRAALAQRAGMAYIRPSSAFLRSSYAGTGLQSDPGLAWRNMLVEHGKRALSSNNNLNAEPKNRVIKEIDKQFWQNINKVRVAGGGDTNYVLAKDDVGNWYVKSYQTNRESIFKSARNLALFGAGAKIDLNLLERMQLEEEFRDKGSGLDSAKEQRLQKLRQEQARAGTPKALSDVYEKFKTQYNASTEAAHEKLMGELDNSTPVNTKLGARIIAAWGKYNDTVLNKYKDRLAADLRTHSDALRRRHNEMDKLNQEKGEDGKPLPVDTKARRQANQVIDVLRSIRDFKASLLSAITKVFASGLQMAKNEAATAKSKYEKKKTERENLETDLEKVITEYENKRSAVSSFENLKEEDQDKKIAEFNRQEEDEKKKIEEQIKASNDQEKELKSRWDADTAKHAALLRAEEAAKTVVSKIAGKLFSEVLKNRQQAVREYERAIVYIGNIPSD